MMWNNSYWSSTPGMFWGAPFATFFATLLIPFMLWSLLWKGWALWKAAKNDSKVWFVVLLLVNTVGILDILYIFVFGKQKKASRKR